jgi:tripartite ATP-independent transporter DctM subunit
MGIDIGIGWLTLVMCLSLIGLLAAGLPMAFVTGGLGCVFLFVFGSLQDLTLVPSRIFPFMTNHDLSAIPLYIFMASVLERVGIIEQLFDVAYKVLGGLRGGLASAAIIACTILAAVCGVVGATEVAMGIIALPAMLRRGYDPQIAMGAILAGGTLGILIPPSVMAIVYAVVAQQSVGELLIGCVVPGLMFSGLYILYVSVRCQINPRLGPPLPEIERVGTRTKLKLLKGIVAPAILILLVIGVLFTGTATPVEAAGIGTFGALVVAGMQRRLSWTVIYEAGLSTVRATAMVMWIFFGATILVGFYVVEGGQTFIAESIVGTGLPPYGILFLMMVILFVLGMLIDWIGILLLTVPIFLPILGSLAFDGLFGLPGVRPEDVPLWYGVIFMVNMQMAFLSPPFGYSLFYLKSVAPPDITMMQVIRAGLPFIGIQAFGLTLVIIFPEIALWLPRQVYG